MIEHLHVALDNGIQFGGLFSERLVTDILRGVGVKASRCNYARVYLNGKPAGVYVNVERKTELVRSLDELAELLETPAREALADHFHTRLLRQPPEQPGGVRETIANHLQHFLAPEVAQVFATPSTFQMRDLDSGRILLVTMPQQFQTERRYVNTFLKLLFYQHALRRSRPTWPTWPTSRCRDYSENSN